MRPVLTRLALAAAFVGLMAVSAQIDVPMTPVPMTMQTVAVLLAGAVLGPLWGGGAVLTYLVLAALGLPIFSDGAGGIEPFSGSTAGYLVAFPIAAVLTGVAAERGWLRPAPRGLAILSGLHILILGLGTAWLATSLGLTDALTYGLMPFLPGAAVKSVLVWLAWRYRPLRP
jgi:biotin transport system substrate-specific component